MYYSCLLSVCVCSLLSPFWSVHCGLCFSRWCLQTTWSKKSLFQYYKQLAHRVNQPASSWVVLSAKRMLIFSLSNYFVDIRNFTGLGLEEGCDNYVYSLEFYSILFWNSTWLLFCILLRKLATIFWLVVTGIYMPCYVSAKLFGTRYLSGVWTCI